jgi:hypothetical protein
MALAENIHCKGIYPSLEINPGPGASSRHSVVIVTDVRLDRNDPAFNEIDFEAFCSEVNAYSAINGCIVAARVEERH